MPGLLQLPLNLSSLVICLVHSFLNHSFHIITSLAHPPALIINASYTVYKINSKCLSLASRFLAATYLFIFILHLPPQQSWHGYGQPPSLNILWSETNHQQILAPIWCQTWWQIQSEMPISLHLYFICNLSFIQLSNSLFWVTCLVLMNMPIFPNRLLY